MRKHQEYLTNDRANELELLEQTINDNLLPDKMSTRVTYLVVEQTQDERGDGRDDP